MGQSEPVVGVDQIAELRALLRRRDVAARQLGLALLDSWVAAELDAMGARAVLEAAGGSYPSISGDPVEPAELLAQMLWDVPHLVPVSDVLRVYLVAPNRARRALIHLLAIRGGLEGLAGLEVLLGSSADPSTVPAPTTRALEPLLAHAATDRVVQLLIQQLGRAGWTWHAADLLARLERAGRVPDARRSELGAALVTTAARLVDACNAAAAGDPRRGDDGRSSREALRSLVPLMDALCDTDVPLAAAGFRMLGSADPRVAALGASQLVRTGHAVAPERFGLISRDPVARADLYDALAGDARGTRVLGAEADLVAVHEGRLARLLAEVTELGRVPDEMEYVAQRPVEFDGESSSVHLFRFRMNAPHWSSARGWMIGASGAFTYTCYVAEDECPFEDHVETMRTALADWPDQRTDGAA